MYLAYILISTLGIFFLRGLPEYPRREFLVACDLLLQLVFHPQLIEIDGVDDFEQPLNQFILPDRPVLAVDVLRMAAAVVHVFLDAPRPSVSCASPQP